MKKNRNLNEIPGLRSDDNEQNGREVNLRESPNKLNTCRLSATDGDKENEPFWSSYFIHSDRNGGSPQCEKEADKWKSGVKPKLRSSTTTLLLFSL